MFFVTPTGLNQDETLGTFAFFVGEALSLTVLHSEIVRGPVNELKGRENLGEIPPGRFEKREYVLEAGKG